MNKFNSVFVKKINNQTGSVFQSDGLTLRGETVQLFNDISTDGIIIFGFQLCSQSLINIIKLCGALYYIFPAWLNFFDIFNLIFIVFITDFAYDFFQKVFQCDQTGSGTVFIQDNSKIYGMLSAFRS